jgi:hypothetical protein
VRKEKNMAILHSAAPHPAAPQSTAPWYREPWPWLLMLGPVGAVVAGAFTLWLAMANEDGLVADDYYKQGLAINEVIGRESEAARLGLQARILVGEARVLVHLAGAAPRNLTLQLAHPTRAGLDRIAQLTAHDGGLYEGPLAVPASGRWHIVIEDDSEAWRLGGEWTAGAGEGLILDAAKPDGVRR